MPRSPKARSGLARAGAGAGLAALVDDPAQEGFDVGADLLGRGQLTHPRGQQTGPGTAGDERVVLLLERGDEGLHLLIVGELTSHLRAGGGGRFGEFVARQIQAGGPTHRLQGHECRGGVLRLSEVVGDVHGIPMAVPHTRPLGTTPHATTSRLLGEVEPVFGTIQVPGSITGLLELRLGEAGRDAMGYAVHVPHYLAQAEFHDAALVAFDALVGATGLDLARDELATSAVRTREQVATELADNDEVRTLVGALERQYDAFMEGRTRPSLLASGMGEVPSADEIAADVEAFLREVNDEGRQA